MPGVMVGLFGPHRIAGGDLAYLLAALQQEFPQGEGRRNLQSPPRLARGHPHHVGLKIHRTPAEAN